MSKETISFLIRAMPGDVYKILLKKQLEYGLEKGRKVNLEQTIIRMIKESGKN